MASRWLCLPTLHSGVHCPKSVSKGQPWFEFCLADPCVVGNILMSLSSAFFAGIRDLGWCASVKTCVALGWMSLQLCECWWK